MNCNEALERLAAWVDGEAPADDAAVIESHVTACEECGNRADEIRETSVALRRAFEPRRAAALRVGEQVVAKLHNSESERLASPRRRAIPRWLGMLLSAAAGFALACFVLPQLQNQVPPIAPSSGVIAATPVARVTAATGPLEFRLAANDAWQPVDQVVSFACPSNSAVRTLSQSRCELETSQGCVIRLNENSTVALISGQTVEVELGQVWCSAPPGVNLEVVSRDAAFSTPQPLSQLPWSMSCPANTSCLATVMPDESVRVTAAEGELTIRVRDQLLPLQRGETALISNGQLVIEDRYANPLLASSWVNPLLALKGHSNDDLHRRVNELLAQIGRSKLSSLYEQELRSLGEYSVLPLLRFVQSPLSRDSPEQRATAMRILADVAPTWTIPDLIELLIDDDGITRMYAARALERLTTLNFGCDPMQWRDDQEKCRDSYEQWQQWWSENRDRMAPQSPEPAEATLMKT